MRQLARLPRSGACVYLLRSLNTSSKPYVGFTRQRIDSRLREHNLGLVPSTSHCRPWALAAAFWFADEQSALAFERYLKSGSGRAFAKRHFTSPQPHN